jgi:hypothetical protein
MKTEILVVTFQRDFSYLEYCIRSYLKFAKGFDRFKILVPNEDFNAASALVSKTARGRSDIAVLNGGEQWADKGMLWHMRQIMHADNWCPTAEFIAHFDSDCVFTGPVTPENYIHDGKPILRFERFTKIGGRHMDILRWQAVTQKCLPFLVTSETMRCHPGVYHRGLYDEARRQVEKKVGQPIDEFIAAQQNAFPQGFCEFNTLGNVALFRFPDRYEAVEQTGDRLTPDNHVQQCWSHGPIDKPQRVWVQGEQKEIVPIEFFKALGL